MTQSSLLRFVLILSVLAIVLFPLYVLFVQSPSFERLLADNTTHEAERIAQLMAAFLTEAQLGARPDRVPPAFTRNAQIVMQDTRILKMKVFSPAGRVLYSTDPREIGRLNEEDYFHSIVREVKGKAQEIAHDTPTLERQLMPADVVETYVPLVREGRTVGVFEIYYDISAEKQRLRAMIRRSAMSVLTLALLLLAAVLVSVQKARRAMRERAQVEKALQASEKRHRALFERAGDAIFILAVDGADAGRIVSANQAAADMHGYTIEELRGMKIQDLDTPDAAQHAELRMEAILQGEWLKTEVMHRKRDGSVFPMEVSAGLLDLGDERYVLAFDRDITERRRTEEGRESLIRALKDALDRIKTLGGLLPICASCKKIRDDKGYWNQIESYISTHTSAEFSHSLCPDCVGKLYPKLKDKILKKSGSS